MRYRDAKRTVRSMAASWLALSSAMREALLGLFHASMSLLRSCSPAIATKVGIWGGGLLLFHSFDFGKVYLILSLFGVVFSSLRHKEEGEVSAYSVFNTGFRRLLGTLTAEDFEKEILHRERRHQEVNQHRAEEPVAVQRHLRGKKARRTYEARLERRRLQAELEETLVDEQ